MRCWNKQPFIALDTEYCTDAASGEQRIIQIAWRSYNQDGVCYSEFQTLVSGTSAIDDASYRIHRIQLEDLKTAPPFKSVADPLLRALKGASFVLEYSGLRYDGFRGADEHIIQQELERCGMSLKGVVFLDVCTMARQVVQAPRFSLDAVCTFLEIERKERHRALQDAQACAEVFLAIRDDVHRAMQRPRKLSHVVDLLVLWKKEHDDTFQKRKHGSE